MSVPMVTADLLTAVNVIGRLASAPLQHKCAAVTEIAASGVSVDQLTVRQLMDIALKAAPIRVGTSTMVATSTAPQRREIVRLLQGAGIDTKTVHQGLDQLLEQARVLMPRDLPLDMALQGISHAGAARLLRTIRIAIEDKRETV